MPIGALHPEVLVPCLASGTVAMCVGYGMLRQEPFTLRTERAERRLIESMALQILRITYEYGPGLTYLTNLAAFDGYSLQVMYRPQGTIIQVLQVLQRFVLQKRFRRAPASITWSWRRILPLESSVELGYDKCWSWRRPVDMDVFLW